jgi:hypothetical protein
MEPSKTTKRLTDEEKTARKLARQEAYRIQQQDKYANDPEYRERVKAANRENGAKRRAKARAERQQEVATPGRPRRAPLCQVGGINEVKQIMPITPASA